MDHEFKKKLTLLQTQMKRLLSELDAIRKEESAFLKELTSSPYSADLLGAMGDITECLRYATTEIDNAIEAVMEAIDLAA